MTALHIRKNIAQALKLTATAVETVQVPNVHQVKEKIFEYRIRAAALIMPKDVELHIKG